MSDKPQWTTAKEFVRGSLVVRVQKLDLYRRPKFSIQIGTFGKKDPSRLIPFLPVEATSRGQVTVTSYWVELSEMVREAEHYVEQELQVHEDLFIDQAQERESRQISRDKPRQKRGIGRKGKTARDRENKRRRMTA